MNTSALSSGAQPPSYQAVVTNKGLGVKRHVLVTLNAYAFGGPCPEREGWAIRGKKRCTEQDVLTITPTTMYNQVLTKLWNTMEQLKMGDFSAVCPTRIYRSVCIMNAQASVVTKARADSWQACREILLSNERYTLNVHAYVAPEGWDWHEAMEEKKNPKCVV